MKNVIRRNNVTIQGDGNQTVMFVHGFGCDQTAWKYIAPAFFADYTLVLIDLIGDGKSDMQAYDKKRYANLDGYALDIIEICHTSNLNNIIFIGHSVSCMIGAFASIKEPSLFSKLIFIALSPRYLNDDNNVRGCDTEELDLLFELMDDDYISWSNMTAHAIMGQENGDLLRGQLAADFCSLDPEIARHFARVTFLSDNRKDLALIPVESIAFP